MKIRTIDLRFSFTEGPQEIDIQNNSDRESEDECVSEELSLDNTEQIYDSNTNNNSQKFFKNPLDSFFA